MCALASSSRQDLISVLDIHVKGGLFLLSYICSLFGSITLSCGPWTFVLLPSVNSQQIRGVLAKLLHIDYYDVFFVNSNISTCSKFKIYCAFAQSNIGSHAKNILATQIAASIKSKK